MINALLAGWNKVLPINGCLREISSLAQWSVHSRAVSTGIYYSVTVNQRTNTQRGTSGYAAESLSLCSKVAVLMGGGGGRGGAEVEKREGGSYF